MENQEESEALFLNNEALIHLKQTSKWTSFLAITAFVFMGLAVMLCLFFAAVSASSGGILALATVIPLLLILLVYFFPVLYLFQFSRLSKQAINMTDSDALTRALQYQKMHYRFMGILMIVLFVLYAIMGAIALNSGALSNYGN